MRSILLKILLSVACSCILFQVVHLSAPDETDVHLNVYSKFNVTHHDNLDDDAHTHRHKHSKDGDEHEHSHEHSKIVQSDFKILCESHKMVASIKIIDISTGFSEKNLFSNPHPFEVFRPPISSFEFI